MPVLSVLPSSHVLGASSRLLYDCGKMKTETTCVVYFSRITLLSSWVIVILVRDEMWKEKIGRFGIGAGLVCRVETFILFGSDFLSSCMYIGYL